MNGSQFLGYTQNYDHDPLAPIIIPFLRINIELKEIERIHSRVQRVDMITFKILVNGEEHGQQLN